MVDVTIKLCPSTNPITTTYTTELHVCKQQHTSFTCYSRYLKHLSRYVYETCFDGQKCTHVFKCL